VTPDPPPRALRRRDALIQGATGLSVTQIFEQDGEESFRSVEAAVLNEVASYGRVVVSTGGGVVTRPQNWGHLRNGIVIYLEAPVECVIRPCVSEVLTHNMQH
jgi:shikimate kinase